MRVAPFALLVALGGCNMSPVGTYDTTITDLTQLYSSLTLDYHVLALATAPGYDTWQLTATPRDASGDTMAGLPAPTFALQNITDTAKLLVTPDGQLTARKAGTNIPVITSLTVTGNIRHADTAYISVATTNPPPTLDSVSVAPVDSGRWAIAAPNVGSTSNNLASLITLLFNTTYAPKSVAPTAWNTTGSGISGLSYEITSLDPSLAGVNSTDHKTAKLIPFQPGPARIVARTTAYGVTRADTAVYTITMPSLNDVDLVAGSRPGDPEAVTPTEVTIRTSGVVSWSNFLAHDVDVTFDDTTNVASPIMTMCATANVFFTAFHIPGSACGTGNMTLPALAAGNLKPYTGQLRQFPVAGVYPFHTSSGATGRVVVVDP